MISGDYLIKKWLEVFSKEYGNGYSSRNMKYMRQFYITFPIRPTVSAQLSYSHLKEILPIKNESERNYYINQVILNNL